AWRGGSAGRAVVRPRRRNLRRNGERPRGGVRIGVRAPTTGVDALPRRLRRLAVIPGPAPRTYIADTPLSRLFGLAFVKRPPVGAALLLPRTRSIHTFGMRFQLDLL